MIKRRKNIRLPNHIYELSPQIFSVTICTQDRRPIFRNEKWAKTLLSSLNTELFSKQTEQYAWCLMPDHLHLLISPRGANLSTVLSAWKSYTGHLLRKNGLEGSCWQRGFYDHALRKEEDIQRVAEYIVNNPVRKRLVENWRDYPFSWHKWMQGESRP
jgi:REP element-mobilizing transposase RayT